MDGRISNVKDSTVSQGALEKLNPQSRSLAVTGESKVPFSQGIVPRKATTMPKPQWHAPWKLMRVCFRFLCLSSLFMFVIVGKLLTKKCAKVLRIDFTLKEFPSFKGQPGF